MTSRCDISTIDNALRIFIKPERNIWDFFWIPFLLAVLVGPCLQLGWSGFFIWAIMGGVIWFWLWNAFGTEEITVTSSTFTVTSRMLNFHHSRNFEPADIEWIAYHPYAYRSPSGLGIMLRSKIMPAQFGHNVELLDAYAILNALKHNSKWLADRVKLPADRSFYNPA